MHPPDFGLVGNTKPRHESMRPVLKVQCSCRAALDPLQGLHYRYLGNITTSRLSVTVTWDKYQSDHSQARCKRVALRDCQVLLTQFMTRTIYVQIYGLSKQNPQDHNVPISICTILTSLT